MGAQLSICARCMAELQRAFIITVMKQNEENCRRLIEARKRNKESLRRLQMTMGKISGEVFGISVNQQSGNNIPMNLVSKPKSVTQLKKPMKRTFPKYMLNPKSFRYCKYPRKYMF